MTDLFYIVPLVSAMCNLYLLLTFLSAKKDKLIRSFIYLLGAFTVWTLSSFLMRMSVYPGELFWFQASMTGIIFVPLFIYNFVYHYTKRRGMFVKGIFIAVTVIMAGLNLLGLFVTQPHITVSETGARIFTYGISYYAFILVAFAAFVVFSAIRLVYTSVAKDGTPANDFWPFFAGIAIMFAAMLLDLVPGLASVFPVDPFACMINALLIYYMLYKKRVFSLKQFASSSSTYLVSAVLTTIILLSFFSGIEKFIDTRLSAFSQYRTVITAVLFSVMTITVFSLLKMLTNNLFVKGQQTREETLKNFSLAINRTLNRDEIVSVFAELINEKTTVERAYIFTFSRSEHEYKMLACTDKLKATAVSIHGDSPLIKWLEAHREGISVSDFKRTVNYKSMWELEKRTLVMLQTEFVLPILCDEELVGVVLLSAARNKKPYSNTEISFLESVASVVSIAFKNADLYETIKEEARMDTLTGIYNRKYFTQLLEETVKENSRSSVSLIMISLDDFKLYNELFGSEDGDTILKKFANILRSVIGTRGVYGRYGGKEFAVCLPVCSAGEAREYSETIRERLTSVCSGSQDTTKKLLTFSAGVCAYPASAANESQLLTYANMSLYAAKKSGKNKTVVYSKHDDDGADALTAENVAAIGQEYASTIYALTAAIDAKDHYTFSHSKNVSYLATQLAINIGLDNEHIEMIRQAGLLHDIGKISIPETILAKTTRLLDSEYSIMKGHVENSISMIRHLPSLDYVVPIAISHHERYDGNGYPRGLKGEEIPVGGRCLAIADAFDAIVSRRPYKEPVPVADALVEIERNLGGQFDPKLGRIFVDLVSSGAIDVSYYA